jgi:hypothetical protein
VPSAYPSAVPIMSKEMLGPSNAVKLKIVLPSKFVLITSGITIELSSAIIFTDVPDTDSAVSFQNLGPNSDFSICTNSMEMIDNIFGLCSFLWDSSKPLKT